MRHLRNRFGKHRDVVKLLRNRFDRGGDVKLWEWNRFYPRLLLLFFLGKVFKFQMSE